FKVKAGIFSQDRYVPILEAIINLGASVILVKYFGLAGIFMGTTISSLFTVFWTAPYMVYKNIFINYNMDEYFKRYFIYSLLTVATIVATSKILNLIFSGETLLSLFGMGIISLFFPTIIYTAIFCKTEEFIYLTDFIKMYLNRLKKGG
ncbi:MAG: hypothetical protein ACRCZ2_01940, partial [Fusobacteriaceae bacterium]